MPEIEGPETVFSDAAAPLLKIIAELEQEPLARRHAVMARAHVERALADLDDAYAALR